MLKNQKVQDWFVGQMGLAAFLFLTDTFKTETDFLKIFYLHT